MPARSAGELSIGVKPPDPSTLATLGRPVNARAVLSETINASVPEFMKRILSKPSGNGPPCSVLMAARAHAATHGSPWRYDTHVPIIFAGPGIEAQEIQRLVHPADVAPTLAALLALHAPAGATGTVLVEVVE